MLESLLNIVADPQVFSFEICENFKICLAAHLGWLLLKTALRCQDQIPLCKNVLGALLFKNQALAFFVDRHECVLSAFTFKSPRIYYGQFKLIRYSKIAIVF